LKKFSTPSKFVFVLSAFLFVFACGNNENSSMSSEINEFPSIQGNNLNKVKKIVPDDFVDRDLIVIVAFQQWHQPLVDESIENLEKDKLDLTHNIIEVPTIRKSTKLNEIYLDGVMRRAIREDRIRNRTITAYIDKEEFKQSLEIPDEQSIYWFLIEKDSRNILLRGSGVITPKEVNLIKSN
jgi:hypothetical protein